VRSSEKFSDTGIWTHLLDKLPGSSLGGYLYVYRLNSQLVLDYLTESGPRAVQGIRFGRNLRSYDTVLNATDTYTVVRPLGAKLEGEDLPVFDPVSENRVNIATASLNPNGALTISDDAQVARLGYREKIVYFDDVHEPDILYSRGQTWLAENAQVRVTVTASPVDLADVDDDEQPWEVGMMVPTSAPDYDGVLQLRAIARSYTNPADKACQLGAEVTTWSSQTAAQIARQADTVTEWVETNYALNAEVRSTVANLYSAINQLPEQIMLQVAQAYVTQGTLETSLEELNSQVTIQADRITSEVTAREEHVHLVDGKLETEIQTRTSLVWQDTAGVHVSNGADGTEILLTGDPKINMMVAGAIKSFWDAQLLDASKITVHDSLNWDKWTLTESTANNSLALKYTG
jgi:hypothetical protein